MSGETTREMTGVAMDRRAHNEDSARANGGELPRRKFIPTAELQAALQGVGWIDPDRFRRDVDSILDQNPTSPHWRRY